MSPNTLIGPNILLTASIAIWLGAIGFLIWPITNANFLIQITSTLFAIVLSTFLYWSASNVCRYNFALEKNTDILNIVTEEIDPTLGNAKV